jgi:hypothetical protein
MTGTLPGALVRASGSRDAIAASSGGAKNLGAIGDDHNVTVERIDLNTLYIDTGGLRAT